MATRNIVPRGNEEGNLGTNLKLWLKGWYKNLFVSNEITDGTYTTNVADIKEAVDKKHDQKIWGTKEIDESAIGNGKVPVYKSSSGKYELITLMGIGDMQKGIYDIDDNGIVDKAESLNDGSSGDANNVTASEARENINHAIHDNQNSEISTITEKTTAHDDDIILLEDSENSYNKKKIKVSNLFGIPGFYKDYIKGLNILPNITNSTYQLDINIGQCKSEDNTTDIEITSPVIIDITNSGANGLDVGSEIADTWYYVWVIKNITTETVAGLFSISSTSPTLPTGYTKKRRIGVIRNNSSSDFLQFFQTGKDSTRRYEYFEDLRTTLLVLSAGVEFTYTDVDCSEVVPPTSQLAYLCVAEVNNAGTANYLRTNGKINPTRRIFKRESLTTELALDENQILEYSASGALDIAVVGFYEEI